MMGGGTMGGLNMGGAMAVASGSFLCATALAELMLHLEGIF